MTTLNESLVFARAKRNFSNDGCGNRMWNAEAESTSRFKLDQALYLTDDERETFIERAREELTQEMVDASTERRADEVPVPG